jgi:hypothetical protein
LLPDGERETFVLDGDEWQLDARVLKWHGAATLLGLDTGYRLDRIGGRYPRRRAGAQRGAHRVRAGASARRGRVEPRAPLPRLAALARRVVRQRNLPADGRRRALRAVSISSTGLLARPLNREAREAVSAWH